MSNARPTDIFNLCQFQFANRRLCGLPAYPNGDGLCLMHARAARAKAAPEQREDDLSPELHSPAGDYITQIDINHVLGKLFDALAANRLSARRASSLAYIASLMLQSQEGAKDEARRWYVDIPTFRTMLKLKYPKNHPNYPKDKKPSHAKPRKTAQAAASTPVSFTEPPPNLSSEPSIDSLPVV